MCVLTMITELKKVALHMQCTPTVLFMGFQSFLEPLIRSASTSNKLITAKNDSSFQLLFKYVLIRHNGLAVNEAHTTHLEDYSEIRSKDKIV